MSGAVPQGGALRNRLLSHGVAAAQLKKGAGLESSSAPPPVVRLEVPHAGGERLLASSTRARLSVRDSHITARITVRQARRWAVRRPRTTD